MVRRLKKSFTRSDDLIPYNQWSYYRFSIALGGIGYLFVKPDKKRTRPEP